MNELAYKVFKEGVQRAIDDMDRFGPRHASRGQLIGEIEALKAENEALRKDEDTLDQAIEFLEIVGNYGDALRNLKELAMKHANRLAAARQKGE